MTHVDDRDLSPLARGLIGSEILKIASEIRALKAAGESVCNLTVGDFSPAEFRIPRGLEEEVIAALAAGETNYPPSDGMLDLRKAVAQLYEDQLALTYPVESVLISGGSRPSIYATYAALVDRGDKVVYPIPSWNNNHYTYLFGGVPVEIEVEPETNFLPTAELIRPHIREARLLCICSPLNPAGTVMAKSHVEAIARLVVEENDRRRSSGERGLFLMWDQVYWMLTFGTNQHHAPMQLVPEVAPYTILVDGISKAFAATGVRIGWVVAPPRVTAHMRDILGHIGAWAPRAEQVALAKFLKQKKAIAEFHEGMIRGLQLRLDLLHDGLEAMRRDGLPVRAFEPQGAIYLSAQFDLIGRGFSTNEEIRRFLLEKARFAVVPFQAFGLKRETGWFRLSVGAVSPEAIRDGLDRVRKAIEQL